MSDPVFDLFSTALQTQGAQPALEALAAQLRDEKRYHELFDVRLMQSRLKAGLSVVVSQPLDELPEPQRSQVEEGYLAACREIGHLLLGDGRVRDAWMYLRPVGDKQAVADALRKLSPEDDYETIVQIALYEGVDATLGFSLLLEHQGCCNAITTFDTDMGNRPKADRQAVAALLVDRVHTDLLSSLKTDIKRQEGQEPAEKTIAEMVADRDWLFNNDNYHIDTSHLSSVVRFSVAIEDPAVLRKAVDLCAYGRHLSPHLQYSGEQPFGDLYPNSSLFFQAQLGNQVDEALAYFKEVAVRELEEGDTGSAEVYVALLARMKRYAEALDAWNELMPINARPTGFAPSPTELAHLGKLQDRLATISRERGDVISYVAGLLDKTAS
ncbi:MAG: hypothetical protein JNM18_24220 [Planctomycetaceae bacterium]|nr:hypothetical protein [Planctomycetaceae bacterium]